MSNTSSEILNSVIDSYSNNFSDSFSPDSIFEYFTIDNYFKDMNFSIEDIKNGLTDSSHDWGIDGFYLFANNTLINDFNSDDYNEKNYPKGFPLTVHLFQIKNKEKIEETVPQKFYAFGNLLCCTDNTEGTPETLSEMLSERTIFFKDFIVKMASKFPTVNIYFHHVVRTNASKQSASYTEKTNSIFDSMSHKMNFEGEIIHDLIGTDELYTYAKKTISTSGSLPFNANAMVPSYLNSPIGYLVTTQLKDYYNFITTDTDEPNNRVLNEGMFESNIRDYQKRTHVNNSIERTIEDTSDNTDFWWLNNGITIIADQATSINSTMQLSNVQIVNGLQTSNSIYNVFKKLNPTQANEDKRSIFIKVIVLDNTDVNTENKRNKIIRATNSQNPVTESQLRSSDPLQRDIELFLKPRGIFYDRKKNYYRNQGLKISKIISINYLSQALVSILDKNPVKARSNPTVLIKEDSDYNHVFNKEYDLKVFYYAALIRLQVSQYLKDLKKTVPDESTVKLIATYYELHVTRVLASLLVNRTDVTKFNLVNIDFNEAKNISKKKINQAIFLVQIAIGNTEKDISKKTSLNDSLTSKVSAYLKGDICGTLSNPIEKYNEASILNCLEETHYDVTKFASIPHPPIPDEIKEDLQNQFEGIDRDTLNSGWNFFCESGAKRDD